MTSVYSLGGETFNTLQEAQLFRATKIEEIENYPLNTFVSIKLVDKDETETLIIYPTQLSREDLVEGNYYTLTNLNNGVTTVTDDIEIINNIITESIYVYKKNSIYNRIWEYNSTTRESTVADSLIPL